MTEHYEHRDMAEAVFHDVNLHRASFDDVNLSEATICNANLAGLTIDDANIRGLTIFGIRVDELIQAELERRNAEESPQVRNAGAEVGGSDLSAERNTVMHYRPLGSTGLEISEVSLGTEYLIGKPHDEIVTVVREAIACGITYFDLFCAEPAFRDAMGDAFRGHRESVHLAAHLGATVKDDGQYLRTRALGASERFFDDFLTRYDTDYVDVLMLHNCDAQGDFDAVFRETGFLGLALRLKEEGHVRHLGFSGHTIATARQAVESGYIDVLMFPINLTGHAVPGKLDLLRTCVRHGVGVVAMKPYAGGKLLQGPRTTQIGRYLRGGEALSLRKSDEITPVRCLAYTLSQVGVTAAVPGCATVAELHAALAYEDADAEARDFSGLLSDFEQAITGECVYCNHCLPCPAHLDIGQTLRLYEMAQAGITPDLRAAYEALPAPASDCTQCGACEARCPFGVPTVARIAEAAAYFAAH